MAICDRCKKDMKPPLHHIQLQLNKSRELCSWCLGVEEEEVREYHELLLFAVKKAGF